MKRAKKFLAILLAAVMAFTLAACKDNYEWSTDKLPKPSSRKGSTVADGDGNFSATIECTERDYQDYINQCRNSGFDAEEYYSRGSGSTDLYSADGSRLSLMYTSGTSYRSGVMHINLSPPIAFVYTEWTNNTASAQIPKPKSDFFGQARGATGDRVFQIFIGNTPYSDYADYVKQCKEAGFDDITHEEPTEFMANNGEYLLIVSYERLNVMFVSISPN